MFTILCSLTLASYGFLARICKGSFIIFETMALTASWEPNLMRDEREQLELLLLWKGEVGHRLLPRVFCDWTSNMFYVHFYMHVYSTCSCCT